MNHREGSAAWVPKLAGVRLFVQLRVELLHSGLCLHHKMLGIQIPTLYRHSNSIPTSHSHSHHLISPLEKNQPTSGTGTAKISPWLPWPSTTSLWGESPGAAARAVLDALPELLGTAGGPQRRAQCRELGVQGLGVLQGAAGGHGTRWFWAKVGEK